MTKEEILEAAKEAGLYMTSPERIAAVERLVAIIEKHTIERCAVVCDESAYEWRGANSRQVELAAAIRKLGEQ